MAKSKQITTVYACPCCGDGELHSDEGELVDCPLCRGDGEGVTADEHKAFAIALKRIPKHAQYREFDAAVAARDALDKSALHDRQDDAGGGV